VVVAGPLGGLTTIQLLSDAKLLTVNATVPLDAEINTGTG
jgi:hypothetical protein